MTRVEGVCVWMTGRSGAGKSTIARPLVAMLEAAGRTVTVLDVVPELGKASGERTSEGKLERKAVVAREVVRHGGVVICVTVSARPEYRRSARRIVGEDRFVEVHVRAPRAMSDSRRNHRSGKRSPAKRVRRALRRIRSVFRPPDAGGNRWVETADIVLDSVGRAPAENAHIVFEHLVGMTASTGGVDGVGGS